MKFAQLLSLCIAATVLPAAGQATKILTADKHNEYGLVYTLPITALEVEVVAERTVAIAGPYYQYAKKYIGTSSVISESYESWTITDIRVKPYGIPDPQQQYLMQLKAGALTYIGVSDDGMLLTINREPQNEQTAQRPAKVQPVEFPKGKEYLQYVTEDFLASQSSAKQAQMLAESLMEVREAKIALTRGTAETMPTDGRQLELMLQSLEDQEKVMTAAFVGSKTTETVTRTFSYTPVDEGKETLFRLSDFAGFVAPDDLSGEPVFISVKVTRQATLPVDDKGVEKKLPKDAVMYALPGAAQITLSWQGKTLWQKELEFAQYGTVFGLSPSLFTDKKDPSAAVFDPATGALKSISSAQF